MIGVAPILAFELTDLLRGDLLWLVLVVGLGILTLIKRGLEMVFGARRGKAPPPGRRPGQAPGETKPAEQATVFEEMKRYFEILEGKAAKPSRRPARESAPTPLPSGLAPPPPTPTPALRRGTPPAEVDLDEAFHLPHGGRRVEAVADQVMTTAGSLAAGLSSKFTALDSNISISHGELARGSDAALSRQQTLGRVRLNRGRKDLRAAILWSEVLGKPRHDNPV